MMRSTNQSPKMVKIIPLISMIRSLGQPRKFKMLALTSQTMQQIKPEHGLKILKLIQKIKSPSLNHQKKKFKIFSRIQTLSNLRKLPTLLLFWRIKLFKNELPTRTSKTYQKDQKELMVDNLSSYKFLFVFDIKLEKTILVFQEFIYKYHLII